MTAIDAAIAQAVSEAAERRRRDRELEALERIADGVQRLAEVMETFLDEATFEFFSPERIRNSHDD